TEVFDPRSIYRHDEDHAKWLRSLSSLPLAQQIDAFLIALNSHRADDRRGARDLIDAFTLDRRTAIGRCLNFLRAVPQDPVTGIHDFSNVDPLILIIAKMGLKRGDPMRASINRRLKA